MKPKIGDKYIVEIDSHMTNKNGDLYGVKGFRSLVFDQNGLNKLKSYDDEMDSAYAEGYALAESKYREARDQVEQEAYQRGLDDAWDAARKITDVPSHGGLNVEELQQLFDTAASIKVFTDHTASEAIEKIREYEEHKAQADEIRNGDEVRFTIFGQDFKAIAIQRGSSGDWQVLNDRGNMSLFAETDLTKTGRHVDLSELFGGEDA